MEMGTIRTKGHEHLPPPLYPPESADITLVLHYGGQFICKPTADYIGGDKVVYDYVNIFDGVNIANLSRWCEGLGVLGEKRFYGILGNGFKLLWDDYELIKWARGCESIRQVHVWVEGNVQMDSETFELHEGCGNLEVQMAEGSGYASVHEGSPLSSLNDSDYEFESTDDELANEVNFNLAFEVGMVFETKNEFKKAIQSHALQTERSLHFIRNEKTTVYARCRGDGCDWGINLIKRVNESIFRIRSYKPAHKCAPRDKDVVHDGDGFDETGISDDDFEVGMVFETKNEFKKAIQSHAIQTRRSIHFKKNDKIRVYARCRGDGCDWGINLIKRVNESIFRIRSYKPTHKCAPTFALSILKSKWLGEKYVSAFQNDPKRNVEGWRKDIMRELNVNVSKWQAYRAKRKALEIIEGFPDKQHSKLYAQKLRRRKCTHQYSSFKKMSSSCTQVTGGEENVKTEVGGEKDVQFEKEPVHFTRKQKLKVSRNKSASTSGVTHANATNQEEDFIVSGPLTRAKTRGRPPTRGKTRGRHPKVSRDKPASTSGVTHANATNQEEDFIVSGPPTRANTIGRPPKLNIDNNSIRPPKSTLCLVDEDEDDEFKAGLEMSTPYQRLQHSVAPPSMPPMLSGQSIRGPPPFLRRNLRPRKHIEEDNG